MKPTDSMSPALGAFAASGPAAMLSPNDRLSLSRVRMRQILKGDDEGAAQGVVQFAARQSLDAVAQHYPLQLVGVSMGLGALLGWAPPWRWGLKPEVMAEILARALTRLPL